MYIYFINSKNPSLREGIIAWIPELSLRGAIGDVAIQAIPNVMRDLIRMSKAYIGGKFSIKICLTGLPRRCYAPPRNDDGVVHSTILLHNDVADTHTTMPHRNDISEAHITS